MKKIFAFVLASLMVLSLVPASAFAAISVDTPCPTIHTVANCDAVIIGSQEADCANPGYTRFQCTKCGEQFLGNIVAAGGHKWVLDEDHKNTKIPACTEGKDGFGHYDCSVCGEAKEEAIPLAKLHDLVFVSGVGCEAAYVCTVCEGTFNSKGGEVGEHAGWELKEVVTEPTAKTNGLAIFVCTAKNCGATKEVTINAQCDCKNDYKSQAAFYNAYAAGKLVLKTKPSKVTCTAAGKYAIYACVDCGAFIRWKTNDSKKSTDLPEAILNEDGQVTGIKNGKFEFVAKNDKATYEIKKLGHSYVADNDKDHPKQVTDACNYSKYCKNCKKYIAQDGHTWFEINSTAATCETYGITYKVCQVCGQNKNEVKDPLGHDLATEVYPSTCGTYGYTITYCKNDTKCTYTKPASGANYYDFATGKVYADVTVDHDAKSSTAKVVRPIVSIVPLTELKGSHTFTTTQIIGGQANCASGLVVMQTCKDCNYVTYTQIAPKGHTFGETTTIEATCTSSGSIMKTCKVCNYLDIIVLPKLTAHKYVQIDLQYNCAGEFFQAPDGRYYHGISTMACAFGCAGTEVKNYIDPVGASSAKIWFESFEDATKYHGATLTLVAGSYRAPSCTSAGYGIYVCGTCGQSVYVTTPAVGHMPTLTPEGKPVVIPGKDATCTESGLKAYSLCATCNSPIVLNEKGEYVSVTTAQLVTNPHSATLVPVVVTSCDGVNSVTYYKCSVDGCGKFFADAEAKTPVAKLPADKAHTWKVLYSGVVLNCNNDGYPEIRYCATCKTLEKTQYAEFLKDGKVVVDVYGSVETWNVEEYAIPTVISYVNGAYNKAADKVAKYSHGEAKNCPAEWAGLIMNHEAYSNAADCDEEYGYVGHLCLICGYEYITDFVTAAGGHYNIYGEKLEESCANYVAVKDRTCINCNKTIGVAAELHNVVKGETIAPTCSTEGYTYSYCKNEGCTWVQVSDAKPAVKPADYHKNTKNLKVGGVEADYATVGNSYTYCPVCLEVIKVQKETKLDEAGLEIQLSTDTDSYIPGSKVYVTVTLNSLKGVDVWGVNFPITYDPAVFKYVGYTFNTAAGAFQTFTVNAVQSYKTFDYYGSLFTKGDFTDAGVVVVAASADDEIAIKGAQTLATFEFEVINYSGTETEATFAVESKSVLTGVELGAEYVSAVGGYLVDESKATVKTYAADVVDGMGKTVPTNAIDSLGNKANYATVNVAGFLDLDGKNGITMADAHLLYALIYNNEYDVLADADFDGKITAYDLNVLYSILVGQITVEDYLNPPQTVVEAAENGQIPQSWWKNN